MLFVRYKGSKCGRMKPGSHFPASVTREKYRLLKQGEIVEVSDEDAKIIAEFVAMEVVVKPKVKKEKFGKVKENSFELEKPSEVFKKDD